MKPYIVVAGNNYEDLESGVNKAIQDGYVPIGGVSFVPFVDTNNSVMWGSMSVTSNIHIIQAMVYVGNN